MSTQCLYHNPLRRLQSAQFLQRRGQSGVGEPGADHHPDHGHRLRVFHLEHRLGANVRVHVRFAVAFLKLVGRRGDQRVFPSKPSSAAIARRVVADGVRRVVGAQIAHSHQPRLVRLFRAGRGPLDRYSRSLVAFRGALRLGLVRQTVRFSKHKRHSTSSIVPLIPSVRSIASSASIAVIVIVIIALFVLIGALTLSKSRIRWVLWIRRVVTKRIETVRVIHVLL